jgi:hypothetical protein
MEKKYGDIKLRRAGIFCFAWWSCIAFYWISSGEPFHLLWLCDLTLLITGIGLLLNNPLLISSQVIGTLLIQLSWNLDFWLRLITGSKVFGFTEYMFSPAQPMQVRILSVFHIFLPVFLIYAIIRLGYDLRGWRWQAYLTAGVYVLSFLTTNPLQDTNWVLGPFWKVQNVVPGWLWLVVWLMLTIAMYWIFHLFLKIFFRLKTEEISD